MSTEKMREEFEAWSANHDYLGGVEIDRAISGNYSDVDVQHAWESWKASRESLVIELPNPDHQCDDGSVSAINQCREAIRASGVKTK